MYVKQSILHQRHTTQGNFIKLPTEVANLPTETGSRGGVATPTYPLSAGPVLLGFTFTAFKNTTKNGTTFLILLKSTSDSVYFE